MTFRAPHECKCYTSYTDRSVLWKHVPALPSGPQRDALLMQIFLSATLTDEYWEVFDATQDRNFRNLILMMIIVKTETITDAMKIQHHASEEVRVALFAKFDLLSFQYLQDKAVTNADRFAVADTSRSLHCRQYALREVLTHHPSSSDLWRVFYHECSDAYLKQQAEKLLALTDVGE